MALPETLGVVTLVGSFVKPDGDSGTPENGAVTLRSDVALSKDGNASVGPMFFKADLEDGAFLMANVPVNSSPDWTPSGWAYLVKEALSGSIRTYYVAIPNTLAGTTVNLADLDHITPE